MGKLEFKGLEMRMIMSSNKRKLGLIKLGLLKEVIENSVCGPILLSLMISLKEMK